MSQEKPITGKQAFIDFLIKILIFFPVWFFEIFAVILIAGWMQIMNDVFVTDDVLYISYGQNVVLSHSYWIKSALISTRSTAIVAIIFAIIIFFSNRFMFRLLNFKNYKLNALYSALLATVIINLSGLYATIEMLIRSYPIWG